jgi:N-acetylmuramoyl-L-alanine amidase
MTAPGDINIPLNTRISNANAYIKSWRSKHKGGIVIVVSIHYNAQDEVWGGCKGGLSVHYQEGDTKSYKFAVVALKCLLQGTIQINRGTVADDLAVTRQIQGDYKILVENGFMDVLVEAQRMRNKAYQLEQAEVIMRGAC